MHHQQPVWCTPFIFFSAVRAPPTAVLFFCCCCLRLLAIPPNVVLMWKTIAMRNQIRQRDTYPFSAQCSNVLPFKGFAYSSKGPLRRAHFIFQSSFVFLPISFFQCTVSKPHHLGSAVCVCTSSNLTQNFFGRRLLLPLALYPFMLVLLGILEKLCSLSPFQDSRTPTSFEKTGPFPAFSTICHDARSVPRLPSTAKTSTAPGRVPLKSCDVTPLKQVDRVGVLTLIDNNRSKLPESEGLVAAPIVISTHMPPVEC